MAIGETALDFLKKEATMDERNVGHVTQKKYLEFMGQNGVTKEVLDAVNTAHRELTNGMYMFNNEQLTSQVATAKKEGRDPSREKATLSINIPNGSIVMTTHAAKTYPIPRQPGATVTKTNITQLDFNQNRLMDKQLCASCEEEMRKQLGL